MLQLKVLSGRMAGTENVARHFPYQVGRGPGNDFVIDEPGMFDRHFTINLNESKEFILQTEAGTFVAVSGQQNVRDAVLKNADLIEVGQTKILFALSPTEQHGLAFRENLTWVALALLTVSQVALIFWLLRA
jgi:pSer/pThr/pTyr-binding forkhead associated (FHA) protein